jgi:tetratricopeptide (TPR) repeat protein
MNCQRVEEEQIIERYLTERLSEAETEAFEQHYLGCQSCFQELQFRHAAAIELKRLPPVLPRPAVVPWSPRWTWGLAAAAVLLLTLVSVVTFYRHQNPQVVQKPSAQNETEQIMAKLAVVDSAPAYVPLTIRGGKTGAAIERFQKGMYAYVQRDYADAIGSLQQAVGLDEDLYPALFYLGICYLMTGQPEKAITHLSRLSRMEANPYSEESNWYLAKAFLKKKDVISAQKELETVVTLKGPHLQEARQALDLIRKLKKGA